MLRWPHVRLSRPSTSFKKDPRLVAERWTLEVHFNYFEKEGEVSDERVVFTHPRSYRKFAEPLVTADLWKSYDCVNTLGSGLNSEQLRI